MISLRDRDYDLSVGHLDDPSRDISDLSEPLYDAAMTEQAAESRGVFLDGGINDRYQGHEMSNGAGNEEICTKAETNLPSEARRRILADARRTRMAAKASRLNGTN